VRKILSRLGLGRSGPAHAGSTGDDTTVGDIRNAKGVAIGRSASATVVEGDQYVNYLPAAILLLLSLGIAALLALAVHPDLQTRFAGPGRMPTPLPPPRQAPADRLYPKQRLDPDQQLVSVTGGYVLTMEGDGNLVLYAPDHRVLWESNTAGNPGTVLDNQDDGNLVLYAPGNKPIWETKTAGNPNSVLIVQDDGNVVLYAPGNKPIWETAGK
jgi:hypothetical protein